MGTEALARLNLLGEDFLFVALGWFGLTVSENEGITACTVPMKVGEEENVSTLQRSLHHQLRVVVNRMKFT